MTEAQRDTRRLVVALELLRQQLADFPLAAILNAQRTLNGGEPTVPDATLSRVQPPHAADPTGPETPGPRPKVAPRFDVAIKPPQPGEPATPPTRPTRRRDRLDQPTGLPGRTRPRAGFEGERGRPGREMDAAAILKAITAAALTGRQLDPGKPPSPFDRGGTIDDRGRRSRGGSGGSPLARILTATLGKRLGGKASRRLKRAGRSALARGLKATGGKVGKGVKAGAGDFGKMLGALIRQPFAQITALLAPMALLAQVIGSNVSGFQLVGAAVKLLAATLAPILLPVFVLLATGLTEISDRVWDDLKPALEGWYELILGTGLPAVRSLCEAMQDAADFFQGIIDWLNDTLGLGLEGSLANGKDEPDTGAGDFSGDAGAGGSFDDGPVKPGTHAGADSGEGGYGPPAGSGFFGSVVGNAARAAIGSPAAGGSSGDAGNTPDRTGKALRDVMGELRQSLAPKASFSGIAQASKAANLAALNSSPFEQKMLDRMATALDKLQTISDRLQQKPEGRYEPR